MTFTFIVKALGSSRFWLSLRPLFHTRLKFVSANTEGGFTKTVILWSLMHRKQTNLEKVTTFLITSAFLKLKIKINGLIQSQKEMLVITTSRIIRTLAYLEKTI